MESGVWRGAAKGAGLAGGKAERLDSTMASTLEKLELAQSTDALREQSTDLSRAEQSRANPVRRRP